MRISSINTVSHYKCVSFFSSRPSVMSEEQSDLPGPLNVDADKLEVTYIRRGPNHPSHPSQAAQTVLRPWLSYPGIIAFLAVLL